MQRHNNRCNRNIGRPLCDRTGHLGLDESRKGDMMIEIVQASTDAQLDQVRDLMRALISWQRQRYRDVVELVDKYYDEGGFEADLAGLPGRFAPPTGRLLLALHDGYPAGCVALHDLGDDTCEMKRMFVDVDLQGRGIGRALANALIHEAKAAGYQRMRLDTGIRQVEAQNLYRGLGFKGIEPSFPLPEQLRGGLLFFELAL